MIVCPPAGKRAPAGGSCERAGYSWSALRTDIASIAVVRETLEACAIACGACADECAKHADMHQHCRICADVCRRCEEACRRLLEVLG